MKKYLNGTIFRMTVRISMRSSRVSIRMWRSCWGLLIRTISGMARSVRRFILFRIWWIFWWPIRWWTEENWFICLRMRFSVAIIRMISQKERNFPDMEYARQRCHRQRSCVRISGWTGDWISRFCGWIICTVFRRIKMISTISVRACVWSICVTDISKRTRTTPFRCCTRKMPWNIFTR